MYGSLVVFNGIKCAQTYDQVIWHLPPYPRAILADFIRKSVLDFILALCGKGEWLRTGDRWWTPYRGILWSLEKEQTKHA